MDIHAMVVDREQSNRAESQRKPNPYSVVERYTQSVRKVIVHARSEALARGETVINVADLLAGLCQQEETRAARIGELKLNAQYLRWLAELPQFPRPELASKAATAPVHCEFDIEARRVLTFAVLEADHDHEHWIDTDHLLRGLLRFPNRAQFAIFKIELHLKAARLASFHDRDEYAPEEEPHLDMMETLFRKYVRQWAPHLLSAACYLYILLQVIVPRMLPTVR